jgi:hypothetical protein
MLFEETQSPLRGDKSFQSSSFDLKDGVEILEMDTVPMELMELFK